MRFQVLIFLTISTQEAILTNPIYEIVAKSALKKCYECDNNCLIPNTINCFGKCFSKISSNSTTKIEQKGCLAVNNSNFCVEQNDDLKVESCSVCAEDLCNSDVTFLDENLGVSECYLCIDECQKPALKQNCQEALTAVEGKTVKAACLSYEITQNNVTTILKGCVSDESVIKTTCVMQNLLTDGIKCSICSEELCNHEEENEIFVDECYTCEGVCDSLQIQNCKEWLGEAVQSKCIAAEFINENGETNFWRGCVEVTDSIQNQCDLVNLSGGNCTICNTNLCNGKEEIENIVDECYFCEEKCDSMTIQNCKEFLGEHVKSKCLAAELADGNIIRSCVEVNENFQITCNTINQSGGNCTVCDTNLCNGKSDSVEEENYVEECYHCENNCKIPLDIQKCKEVLGENIRSKCFAIEHTNDGTTINSRGCVEVNDEFLLVCDGINSSGGNCTICDTDLCNGMEEKSSGKISFSNFSLITFFLIVFSLFI